MAAAGKQFAFIRASAGSLTADSRYVANRAEAKAVGIPMNAYHFANPDAAPNDALNEANWFLSLPMPTKGELLPALDLEVTNGLSVTHMQAWALTWLDRVLAVTGVRPIIYSSPNFWATSMGDTRAFADAGYKVLWVAHWGASTPAVPGANWGWQGLDLLAVRELGDGARDQRQRRPGPPEGPGDRALAPDTLNASAMPPTTSRAACGWRRGHRGCVMMAACRYGRGGPLNPRSQGGHRR